MSVDVLLGLQWGDEGKGKIVDYLANDYDIIARFQGGPNAGHTLYYKDKKIVLHHIPSGIFHDHMTNLIGNGVVIDPVSLRAEIEEVQETGVDVFSKLVIAEKAHLILPTHRMLDAASEASKGKAKIGSTLRGIGPTYMDKIGRNGLRVGDIKLANFDKYYTKLKTKHLNLLAQFNFPVEGLDKLEAEWLEAVEFLRQAKVVSGAFYINSEIKKGKKVLAEGAQGTMLDIDFGTYPFVTSSNTITAGVCNGLGVAPSKINEVIGITKAYCTRVGSGPFPSELNDDLGESIRQAGGEFGATTGRPRRCGWIDLPALRYAIMINGVTQLVVTKVDILSKMDEIGVCDSYTVDGELSQEIPFDMERQQLSPNYRNFPGWNTDLDDCISFNELPENLDKFIKYLEKELEVSITLISIGPKRDQLIKPENSKLVLA